MGSGRGEEEEGDTIVKYLFPSPIVSVVNQSR